MKKTKWFPLLLAVVLLISTASFAVANSVGNSNQSMVEKAAQDKISSLLTDGFSEYYDINSIKFNSTDVKSDDGISYEVLASVTMNDVLKAKKVEDLPFFRGMLDKANLKDYAADSPAQARELIKAANASLADSQLDSVTRAISRKYEDLQPYIGESSDNNFIFKVVLQAKDGAVDTAAMKVYYETFDSFQPAEDILPLDEAAYKTQGAAEIVKAISQKAEDANNEVSAQYYANYNRLNARDYANAWSSNPTSCYDDGSSCGIKQYRPGWNNSSYPYYTMFKHNDCADFVSQCLYAGGIPTDSTWNRSGSGTSAWINVGSLRTYMLTTKGYFDASNYTNASAGGVIMLYDGSSFYHTVLIVKNDTVTRQYTGHTNDRKQVNYSSTYWGSGVTPYYYTINQ